MNWLLSGAVLVTLVAAVAFRTYARRFDRGPRDT